MNRRRSGVGQRYASKETGEQHLLSCFVVFTSADCLRKPFPDSFDPSQGPYTANGTMIAGNIGLHAVTKRIYTRKSRNGRGQGTGQDRIQHNTVRETGICDQRAFDAGLIVNKQTVARGLAACAGSSWYEKQFHLSSQQLIANAFFWFFTFS